ncbi:hypothetical protein D3C80_1662860 [compost metagenome]
MTTTNGHRWTAFSGSLDHRAHFPQRIGDAVHRTLGQRSIASQHGVERLRSEQAGQQAHGSTGVTQVNRARRRLQAIEANTVNGHPTMVRAFDDHTHVAESL